jgi:hypothetical protein
VSIHPSNGSTAQIRPWPPSFRFLNHTELDTHGTLLWTSDQPITEASTYTGQHTYKHKRQTSMPRVGFETTIPATKRPQTARPLESAKYEHYFTYYIGILTDVPVRITDTKHSMWELWANKACNIDILNFKNMNSPTRSLIIFFILHFSKSIVQGQAIDSLSNHGKQRSSFLTTRHGRLTSPKKLSRHIKLTSTAKMSKHIHVQFSVGQNSWWLGQFYLWRSFICITWNWSIFSVCSAVKLKLSAMINSSIQDFLCI